MTDLIEKLNNLRNGITQINAELGTTSRLNIMEKELDKDIYSILDKYNIQFRDYKKSLKPEEKGWGENFDRTMGVIDEMNKR